MKKLLSIIAFIAFSLCASKAVTLEVVTVSTTAQKYSNATGDIAVFTVTLQLTPFGGHVYVPLNFGDFTLVTSPAAGQGILYGQAITLMPFVDFLSEGATYDYVQTITARSISETTMSLRVNNILWSTTPISQVGPEGWLGQSTPVNVTTNGVNVQVVPEPSTLALLLPFMSLVLMRRRRS